MPVVLPEALPDADAGKSADLAPDAPEPVDPASSDAVAHLCSQSAVPSVLEVALCIRAADRFAEQSCAGAAPVAAEEPRVASQQEPAAGAPEPDLRLVPSPLAESPLGVQLVVS